MPDNAPVCNTCAEQQNAAGYCTNKQCSRHGRRNDYLANDPPVTDAPAEREMTAVSRRDYIDSLDWATRELLNKYGARTDGIAALERLRDWLALSVPVEP